jgi:hypothetical protein
LVGQLIFFFDLPRCRLPSAEPCMSVSALLFTCFSFYEVLTLRTMISPSCIFSDICRYSHGRGTNFKVLKLERESLRLHSLDRFGAFKGGSDFAKKPRINNHLA